MPKQHSFIALSYLNEKDAHLIDAAVNNGWEVVAMAPRASMTVILLRREVPEGPSGEENKPSAKVVDPSLSAGPITEALVDATPAAVPVTEA